MIPAVIALWWFWVTWNMELSEEAFGSWYDHL